MTYLTSSIRCASCGVEFCVPRDFDKKRRQDGKTFHCPNGHSLSYRETELDRVRAQVRRLERRLDQRQNVISELRMEIREMRDRIKDRARPDDILLVNRIPEIHAVHAFVLEWPMCHHVARWRRRGDYSHEYMRKQFRATPAALGDRGEHFCQVCWRHFDSIDQQRALRDVLQGDYHISERPWWWDVGWKEIRA